MKRLWKQSFDNLNLILVNVFVSDSVTLTTFRLIIFQWLFFKREENWIEFDSPYFSLSVTQLVLTLSLACLLVHIKMVYLTFKWFFIFIFIIWWVIELFKLMTSKWRGKSLFVLNLLHIIICSVSKCFQHWMLSMIILFFYHCDLIKTTLWKRIHSKKKKLINVSNSRPLHFWLITEKKLACSTFKYLTCSIFSPKHFLKNRKKENIWSARFFGSFVRNFASSVLSVFEQKKSTNKFVHWISCYFVWLKSSGFFCC